MEQDRLATALAPWKDRETENDKKKTYPSRLCRSGEHLVNSGVVEQRMRFHQIGGLEGKDQRGKREKKTPDGLGIARLWLAPARSYLV